MDAAESYRFVVGDIECIAVADGIVPYAADDLFVNAPKERAEQIVRERDLRPEEIPLSYTSLLIDTGRQRVLVDTGLGAGVVLGAGELLDNLRAEGIGAEDVDTIVLTHGHPDHIGGNTDTEGKPAFPDTRYVVWKGEWDFWTSASTLGKLEAGQVYRDSELDRAMGMFARDNLPPIWSRIDLIEDETEIVAGVHAIPAPGHTPGHITLLISSGEEQVLHLVDTVVHPIHLEQPEWYPLFDLEAEQAATTRRKLLDRAAAEDGWFSAPISLFPVWGTSLGRARGGNGNRSGERYEPAGGTFISATCQKPSSPFLGWRRSGHDARVTRRANEQKTKNGS